MSTLGPAIVMGLGMALGAAVHEYAGWGVLWYGLVGMLLISVVEELMRAGRYRG